MAASVADLIALAEHESRVRNPAASAVQGLLAGVGEAQNNSLDRTIRLMQMDQMRREQEQQAEMQAQIKGELEGQREGIVSQAHKGVSGGPSPVLPAQKLKVEISQDEKGRYSRKFVSTDTAGGGFQAKEYADAQGRARIGRFNPTTGKVEQSPDDVFAPVSKNSETDPVKRAKDLRNEFTDLSKDFFKVNESVARVRASAKDPSAAGDLALIFNYMKVLDPGSVVRESEFATAANAAGVPDRIRAQYNKVLNGERLAPDTRADFSDRAERLFEEQRTVHDRRTKEYERLAEAVGADPKQVIVNPILDKAPGKPQKIGRFEVTVEP